MTCWLHSDLIQRLTKLLKICLYITTLQDIAMSLILATISLSELANPLVQLRWTMFADESLTYHLFHFFLVNEVFFISHIYRFISLCLVLVNYSIHRVPEFLWFSKLSSPNCWIRLISIQHPVSACFCYWIVELLKIYFFFAETSSKVFLLKT